MWQRRWLIAFTLLALTVRRSRAEPPPSAANAAPAASVPPPLPPVTTPATSEPTAVPAPPFGVIDASPDRPIRVLPAASPGPRALIYLHGYCGDVNAVGAFAAAAAAHGTLIALLGDQPCKNKPGRFKWSTDTHALDARIRRAIRLVNRAQELTLSAEDITLFGYSQGAVRAEALAQAYGKRYPRVILGGPPRRPKSQDFPHAKAVAVFGGELEDTHDMVGGADDLTAAGLPSRFFLLPGADHGDFGGELAGNRALTEIFSFVLQPNADSPTGQREPVKLAE